MLVSRCRDCGAPLYTRIFRTWNSDGTVTGRFSSGIRICHIDAAEVTGIVEGISARIGHPIERIVVEAERKAGRSITDETLSAAHGLLGLLGRSRLGSRSSLNIGFDVSRCVGYGSAEVLEYKRGQRVRVRVDDPFCVPVVVGDVWGMFEALHLVTAKARWEEAPGSVTIELEKVVDGLIEEDPDRLALKKMATLSGEVVFDRCPRCGVPREVTGSIIWDLDRGVVLNKSTGRREATIMVEAMNALIHELTEELGEEIPRFVVGIEQSYITDVLGDSALPNTEREYRFLLEDLETRGMGNPVEVAKSRDRLRVRVNNPFCEIILAGRIAGFYKALEGVEPKVTWTPDDEGFTLIEVEPA